MTELSGQVTDDHGDTSEGSELTSKFFLYFFYTTILRTGTVSELPT